MYSVKDNLELVKDLAAANLEVSRQLGDLNLRTWEKLAERQMDALGLWINTSVKQLELAAEIKDPKALLEAELAAGRELSEKLAAENRDNLKLAGDLRDEYRSWYETSVETISGKLETVTKAAA